MPVEAFAQIELPSPRDENWKFTNLAPLAKIAFEPATEAPDASRILAQFPHHGTRIVFVNGQHIYGSLAPDSWPQENSLQYFAALNAAFANQPAAVHIRGVVSDPIHVIHVALPGAAPKMSHPRNLFIFEPGAQASIIESYVGEGVYFHNPVTKIFAGEGAVVEHVKIQRESRDAFHISSIQIEQARGSVFTSRSFAFGGSIARTEIYSRLEEGAECTLNGLYCVTGKQHVDTRTVIDHAKPHAASHELYKGILDGQSSAVFNGKIIVRKDAQKTDAKQTNKNLVLSEDATINTKPQLEIFADDVKCTHGATVGQLDADSMFYLRSRGIGHAEARAMLIHAFAHEIINGIKDQKFRQYVGTLL